MIKWCQPIKGFKNIQENLKINLKMYRQPVKKGQNRGHVLQFTSSGKKVRSGILNQLKA